MKLLGIVWTGVETAQFDAMATFMERLIGTVATRQEPGFRLWSLPDGDIVELYAGGAKPSFGSAPVAGFRVGALHAGRNLLADLGAEIVGSYGPNADGYASIHFRAPDGNIYELTYDPDHERRMTTSSDDQRPVHSTSNRDSTNTGACALGTTLARATGHGGSCLSRLGLRRSSSCGERGDGGTLASPRSALPSTARPAFSYAAWTNLAEYAGTGTLRATFRSPIGNPPSSRGSRSGSSRGLIPTRIRSPLLRPLG